MSFCFHLEYAEYGSLQSFISNHDLYEEYGLGLLLNWAHDIALGMNYLHYEAPIKIIHRDLKSNNVLITGDEMTCKICDFGSSRFGIQTTKMTLTGVSHQKTFAFCSDFFVQLFFIIIFTDISVDVAGDHSEQAGQSVVRHMVVRRGALGAHHRRDTLQGHRGVSDCVSHRRKGLRKCVQKKSNNNKKQHILQCEINSIFKMQKRLPIPNGCPPVLSSLMQICWQTEPKARPTFKQILSTLDQIDLDGS